MRGQRTRHARHAGHAASPAHRCSSSTRLSRLSLLLMRCPMPGTLRAGQAAHAAWYGCMGQVLPARPRPVSAPMNDAASDREQRAHAAAAAAAARTAAAARHVQRQQRQCRPRQQGIPLTGCHAASSSPQTRLGPGSAQVSQYRVAVSELSTPCVLADILCSGGQTQLCDDGRAIHFADRLGRQASSAVTGTSLPASA